jgi:hypothetical protein
LSPGSQPEDDAGDDNSEQARELAQTTEHKEDEFDVQNVQIKREYDDSEWLSD